ncbi:MAG TPA: GatB/YqeY domain-containing protein [Chitinophagales bacterium]|nr:GatB/YqeY domain-containing protein [Chitinophagales bacterium]HRG84456.1 GatB/YqeY domain-containing protein [Chitinophagales bacterium]HRH52081.1 GatB/YqeY domain-containing protein [Chitinophagales bacterium]
MSIFDQVNEGIKNAMKNKEEATLRALRGVKSALLLAKTEKGAADELSEEKEIQVLQKLVKQRKESLEIYTTQNRPELAAVEAEEIAVIEKFLPKQMDEATLRTELQNIITTVGAAGPQDMGKVMGAATKQLAGKADGKMISQLVKELLAK